MRRLIYSDIKQDIADVLGVCVTDSRVLRATNLAQERLLNRSTDPVGSTQRYRVCAGTSNCVVLPRQVRHVKAFWLCNEPGLVLSEWWESLGYWNGGRGLVTDDMCNGTSIVDQGTACSFSNVVATTDEPRKIQVVASDASDVGKLVTLRYYDSNGNRVYTSINGVVQEGEQLALSLSGTLTSSNVMTNGLYHVVKAVTNYPIRLYSWDTNSSIQDALIALYEPSETVPIYRQMYVPGLTTRDCACGGDDDDDDEDCEDPVSVTLAVRLQHVPVVVDNDPLVVGNPAALIYMARAHKLRLQNEVALAQEAEGMAAMEVDGEISAYLGDGVEPVIRTPDSGTWGGNVFSPVGGFGGNW